jgi:hypothetical protein
MAVATKAAIGGKSSTTRKCAIGKPAYLVSLAQSANLASDSNIEL